MPAFVTDQFRILNTNNFVDSISNNTDYYYIFKGLPNPGTAGFGRDVNWDGTDGPGTAVLPSPVDNSDYLSHYGDTLIYGKRISSDNVRRCIRKITWKSGTKYDMYRHDYSVTNRSAVSDRPRLYDSNFYVMNSQFQVYICISNGSNGDNLTGNQSLDEPTFTDLEPSSAGSSGDGYIWKYLFTVSPSDILKFDSTEFISLPNSWSTSTDSQIENVRNNGDSELNNNQIKYVQITNKGSGGYQDGEVDILGDGTGGKVYINTNSDGEITKTTVTVGGKGYSYAIVDLGPLQTTQTFTQPAILQPIIPPSRGHGYDIYREIGSDKVLIYSRFDDSTKDFPTDSKFAQIGILKNPSKFVSAEAYTASTFTAAYSLKVNLSSDVTPTIGEKMTQSVTGGVAAGYVASYDKDTGVLKYIQDRSLYYNQSTYDQTDYVGISTSGKLLDFSGTGSIVGQESGFSASIDATFSDSSVLVSNRLINLDATFTNGVAKPEINKTSGDIIFMDNRALVTRNSRQKEDIKIILEF